MQYSRPLEGERNALADADAHGSKRELALVLFKAVDRGERESCSRHSQGMAERDGAAMGIHLLGIVGKSELAQTGKRLRSEGLSSGLGFYLCCNRAGFILL